MEEKESEASISRKLLQDIQKGMESFSKTKLQLCMRMDCVLNNHPNCYLKETVLDKEGRCINFLPRAESVGDIRRNDEP